MKVAVPPIKSQGIKTKLVPWIKSVIPSDFKGKWVEPFMGTGVVAFNLAPKSALLCDTNPHLINFYNGIKQKDITASSTREFLEFEGRNLSEKGEDHYYYVRERFNKYGSSLDFLFLNRAGFNGMIRFNQKGEFNIPFCRKINRFSKAYVSKIVNQVDFISALLKVKDFTFCVQSFEDTINQVDGNDIIYCDPPYINRHVDYFNSWNDSHERALFSALDASSTKFILSTWHHNDFRANEYVKLLWSKNFNIATKEHYYHVGGSEDNRNPMIETLVTNFQIENRKPIQKMHYDTQITSAEMLTA